jgi:hypothetical protein
MPQNGWMRDWVACCYWILEDKGFHLSRISRGWIEIKQFKIDLILFFWVFQVRIKSLRASSYLPSLAAETAATFRNNLFTSGCSAK